MIYVPFLQTAFHTVPLTGQDWLVTAGVGATLLVVVELAKLVLRAQRRAAAAPHAAREPARDARAAAHRADPPRSDQAAHYALANSATLPQFGTRVAALRSPLCAVLRSPLCKGCVGGLRHE